MVDAAVTFACPRGDRRAGSLLTKNIAPVCWSQSSLKGLFAAQVTERYPSARPICWETEPATHVFQLLEGCVRVYRTLEDGRRAILRFGYAGDLLCLSAFDTYLFTADAVTPIRFRRLTRHRFIRVVDASADLRAQLHAEVCGEMRTAQDQIIRLGRTGADERVATFSRWRSTRALAQPRWRSRSLLGVSTSPTTSASPLRRSAAKWSKLKLSMNGPHRIVLRRMRRLREIARMDAPELSFTAEREPGVSRHAPTVAA
jgi:CRP-like cAMP-binding protein